MLQDPLKSSSVKSDDGLEGVLGYLVETATLRFGLMFQQLGAHHGSERQGNNRGNKDGYAERDSEFAEKPADDITHEKKGDEHGDERDRQRNDSEADLLRAFQGGLQ